MRIDRRRALVVAGIVTATAALGACGGADQLPAEHDRPVTHERATVARASSVLAGGDGDLWPSCWGRDGALYAAYGDGKGFGGTPSDIGVARISGDVDHLSGRNRAAGDEVGTVWSGAGFTRKPSGMACRGGHQYLAVQNLSKDFNSAPTASISASDDGGRTWHWDHTTPMFADGVFTTIMFLDDGRDGAGTHDGYVYAYGIDGNWRDSYTDVVDDPTDLYLARVPEDSVQDRSTWRFFSGLGAGGAPVWGRDIDTRRAVLHDARRVHEDSPDVGVNDLSVISQGGVTYDASLHRYLYTSWTEFTFELYQSEHSWGPFTTFLSKDFGPYPWSADSFGGYGLSIPSKFISRDGRSMHLQSNVCPCAPAGLSNYDFSLRALTLPEGFDD